MAAWGPSGAGRQARKGQSAAAVVQKVCTGSRVPFDAGPRTQAATACLCTSSPHPRSISRSMVPPPRVVSPVPGGASFARLCSACSMATMRGADSSHVRLFADSRYQLQSTFPGIRRAVSIDDFHDARVCPRLMAIIIASPGLEPDLLRAHGIRGSRTYRPDVTGQVGVLATGRQFASEAGLRMLLRGGNAVDGVVADAFPWYEFLTTYFEPEVDAIQRLPSGARIYLQGHGATIPPVGSLFRQPELARTLRALAEEEQRHISEGRKAAIYAARDRFYMGDIGQSIAQSVQDSGGLLTAADLAAYRGKSD